MKKRFVSVFICISFFVLFCIPVIGASATKNISVTFRNIKIKINSLAKQTSLEPFVYNDSTYVPLRFVSEALNASVTWDDATSTISINQKASPEALEALKTVEKEFGKEFTTFQIKEPLYQDGILFFYISMSSLDKTSEYVYYNTKTKDCIFFLDSIGG